MADLDVQPKKKSSWWLWLLLALLLLLLLIFFTRGCNKSDTTVGNTDSSSAVTGVTTPSAATNTGGWDDIDMNNAPAAAYEEITDSNISVRGNDNYGIYDIGENILFDEGKSTIRPDAEKNLKQLSASIQKRFNGGDVRIYGYTDSIGSTGSNKQLAEQRAEAVRGWFAANGISADHLSVNAVGEAKPVATNATEKGRQQNRRVEVVARKAK